MSEENIHHRDSNKNNENAITSRISFIFQKKKTIMRNQVIGGKDGLLYKSSINRL